MEHINLDDILAERKQLQADKKAHSESIAKIEHQLHELDIVERYLRNKSFHNKPDLETGIYAPLIDNTVKFNVSLPENRRVRLGAEKRKVYQAISLNTLTKFEIERDTGLDSRAVRAALRDGIKRMDVFAHEEKYGLTDTGIALLDAVIKRNKQVPPPSGVDLGA